MAQAKENNAAQQTEHDQMPKNHPPHDARAHTFLLATFVPRYTYGNTVQRNLHQLYIEYGHINNAVDKAKNKKYHIEYHVRS